MPTSLRGKRVAAKRKTLGISQSALATRCKCGLRTVQRLEADESDEVSLRVLRAVSKHLGLPIEELVTGKRQAREA
jgi:transcriptional regulator with XRE-family HTH domain